jgi:hypothetical protein
VCLLSLVPVVKKRTSCALLAISFYACVCVRVLSLFFCHDHWSYFHAKAVKNNWRWMDRFSNSTKEKTTMSHLHLLKKESKEMSSSLLKKASNATPNGTRHNHFLFSGRVVLG